MEPNERIEHVPDSTQAAPRSVAEIDVELAALRDRHHTLLRHFEDAESDRDMWQAELATGVPGTDDQRLAYDLHGSQEQLDAFSAGVGEVLRRILDLESERDRAEAEETRQAEEQRQAEIIQRRDAVRNDFYWLHGQFGGQVDQTVQTLLTLRDQYFQLCAETGVPFRLDPPDGGQALWDAWEMAYQRRAAEQYAEARRAFAEKEAKRHAESEERHAARLAEIEAEREAERIARAEQAEHGSVDDRERRQRLEQWAGKMQGMGISSQVIHPPKRNRR